MLGGDEIPPPIATLPNVAVARQMGAVALSDHLAMIEAADAFMGMMSGPSNFALFDKPYAIFKNRIPPLCERWPKSVSPIITASPDPAKGFCVSRKPRASSGRVAWHPGLLRASDMTAGFTGKVALVTGAGRGIGRNIATLLSERGAKVALCDIDAVHGAEAVTALAAKGGSAEFFAVDLARIADIKSLVDAVIGRFGRLDVVTTMRGGCRRVTLAEDTS